MVSLDFHIRDAYGAPLGGPFRSSAIIIVTGNFVAGQNNSKYHKGAPLKRRRLVTSRPLISP